MSLARKAFCAIIEGDSGRRYLTRNFTSEQEPEMIMGTEQGALRVRVSLAEDGTVIVEVAKQLWRHIDGGQLTGVDEVIYAGPIGLTQCEITTATS